MSKTSYTLARQQERDSQEFMQAMLRDLGGIARAQRMDAVAYLIEMAYVEVSDVLRGSRPIRQRKGSLAPAKRSEAA